MLVLILYVEAGGLLFTGGRVEEDQQQTATELCIPISAFLFLPLPNCHSNTKESNDLNPSNASLYSAGIDGVEKSN